MPTSIDYDILAAVKTKIDTASSPDFPPVVIRRNMAVLDGDSLPIIVIGYPYGENTSDFIFGAKTDVWQVGVAIVSANNRDFTTNIDVDLLLRDQLKDLLTGVRLTGVTAVWDTDVDNGPPIKIPTAQATGNYQVSTFRVSYKTSRSFTRE